MLYFRSFNALHDKPLANNQAIRSDPISPSWFHRRRDRWTEAHRDRQSIRAVIEKPENSAI
jgi:hypothetical protein